MRRHRAANFVRARKKKTVPFSKRDTGDEKMGGTGFAHAVTLLGKEGCVASDS